MNSKSINVASTTASRKEEKMTETSAQEVFTDIKEDTIRRKMNALARDMGCISSRMQLNNMILSITRERLEEVKEDLYGKTASNGLPLTINAMATAASIAGTAVDFYESMNGDMYDFICWFVSSSLRMIADEYTGKRKPNIATDPFNFFRIFQDAVEKDRSLEQLALAIRIDYNLDMMVKAACIAKEY